MAAVDLVDSKLEMARALGAEYTVNAGTEDPAESIQALGGADQAIALAASPTACEQAYRSLKRGGTLVLVGLPADNTLRLPIFETVLQGITVTGSIVGTRVDLAETFQLHAEGRTSVVARDPSAGRRQHVVRADREGRDRRPAGVRFPLSGHPSTGRTTG